MRPLRGLGDDELLAERVALAGADMDAGKHVVDVALDQVQAMLERGVEGGAEVVGVDDRGDEAELPRQRHRLHPREILALLDVEPRLGEFGDAAHVVEMGVD